MGAVSSWYLLLPVGRLAVCRREVRVDELHHHRTLADRSRAPLRRAGAHVAGREDAGHVGGEQVIAARVVARKATAFVVACPRVAEPLGAGVGAEEEEQERERESLAALQRDRLELPVA